MTAYIEGFARTDEPAIFCWMPNNEMDSSGFELEGSGLELEGSGNVDDVGSGSDDDSWDVSKMWNFNSTLQNECIEPYAWARARGYTYDALCLPTRSEIDEHPAITLFRDGQRSIDRSLHILTYARSV